MKTQEYNLQISQVLKQNHILRSRLEKVRSRLKNHIEDMQVEIDELSAALKVEYTNYAALFKESPDGWICIACFDTTNIPEDLPEDFDLCLPIPKPETLPEWEGW